MSSTSPLPSIKCFDIDVLPIYRAICLCIKNSKSVSLYRCNRCCSSTEIAAKSLPQHVFSGHSTANEKIRRLVYKSNDGSRYTCFCGFTVLSFYVELFAEHFMLCLGFKTPLPLAFRTALKTFRTTQTYTLCQEAIQACNLQPATDDVTSEAAFDPEDIDEQIPIHMEDPLPSRAEIVAAIKEQLAHPAVDNDALTKVFGATVTDNNVTPKSNKHRLRIRLRNHVSTYLHMHVSPNEPIECKHCNIRIDCLRYIQHSISEHVDHDTYGASALVCPNCLTYVCRMIYSTGYHYATMLCHVIECILNSLDISTTDSNYTDFVTTFNQICLSTATHSPYVVNKINPGYEYESDRYFSLDELINVSRPDHNNTSNLGESVVRSLFNLGTADLHDEFGTFLRVNCDKPVEHYNGECKICRDDMQEMLERMRYDPPGLSTEYLLTTEQFRLRFPGTLPRFISARETPLVEPIQGISGIKLFMLEVAARLPNRQLHQIPEEQRGNYLYATHTYVYKGKAASIFAWLERNSHRVFVFPNSTLCWDWNKFDREFDPMDLTNTHRHLIIVYDTYATYREFSNQQFNFDPPFQAAAAQLIRHGGARRHRVHLIGKISKVIISPQHLFGATIYISRFKIPDNPRFRSQRLRNPGNNLVEAENFDVDHHYEGALNLLNEYDYHQANVHRDVEDETLSDEAKVLKHCYNSSTSDHHEMTRLMSRHAKIVSYSLYKNGLTDWYIRSRIYNEILWLHQATNLRTFPEPPLSRPDTIDWPDRNDLSNTYISLDVAKSVLPGYISNHPVEIIRDTPEYKESRDRLRSFGGILFDSSSLFIYRDQEFCYVRLSLNCAKRLVNYIQTVSTRINEFSGMIMFNSTAVSTICEMKKIIGRYKIALDDYEKREAEYYVKHIQQVTNVFALNCSIDNIMSALAEVLNGTYSTRDKQLQAFIVVAKRLMMYNSQMHRLSEEQIGFVTLNLLRQAKQMYETIEQTRSNEAETEILARHLEDRLRVFEDRR